jgi:diacylglycerol kinase (ATP)
MFINPKSGSLSQQLTPQELRTKLEGYDLNPEIHIGENGEAIKKFIRQVQVRRPSCVLVAGGDGTIGSVLKGLIDMKCTFGIIPAGSLNNLAGTLGLSGDIDQALEVIKQGKTRRIDAARVGNDIMFEALGLGMFAEILDKTDWDTDKNVGQLVARSAVQVVTQQPITVNAVIDGKSRHFETIWLAVANTQKIGALTLDPTSSPDDGKLELLYCRPLNALELPAYAVKFLQGDHLEDEKFERIQGKHISLSFPHDTVVHIDDQIYHRSRLEVTVLPRILELFAP